MMQRREPERQLEHATQGRREHTEDVSPEQLEEIPRVGVEAPQQLKAADARRGDRVDLEKLNGLIRVRHCEIDRLLLATEDGALKVHTRALVDNFDWSTTMLEPYHAHLDKLDELDPFLGDVHRVCAVMERELQRQPGEMPVVATELFEREYIDRLLRRYRNEARLPDHQLKHLRECLSRLARERDDKNRHDRVTAKLKRSKVNWFFLPLLFLLTIAFLVTGVVAQSSQAFWTRLLFAAIGGAVGSMMSGARNLRNMFAMDDVKRFFQWIWLQPVFGAAAALVVFFAYVKIHDDGQNDWVAAGLVGFGAGFSEPFFLRTVERVTGTESKPDSSPPLQTP